MLVADTGREAPEAGVKFYRAAGWPQEDLDKYVDRFGGFGKAVSQLPDAFHRLGDGDELSIGGRTWRIVTGCGHSPDHACLWCPELNLLISGDQILPRISSNVSVFPTEPEADPLSDWLRSCRKLKETVPADVLVLPAPSPTTSSTASRSAPTTTSSSPSTWRNCSPASKCVCVARVGAPAETTTGVAPGPSCRPGSTSESTGSISPPFRP
jgi:glyoxylase-like metal-dependent hydrolase (beta-lactamase superfamily II)